MNRVFDIKCVNADPQSGICDNGSTSSPVAIGFTPNVATMAPGVINNSKQIGNIVNINFTGTTQSINITAGPVVLGSISGSFPLIDIPVPVGCEIPGIVIAQILTSGVVETCVTGFPFPISTHVINFNTTYFL